MASEENLTDFEYQGELREENNRGRSGSKVELLNEKRAGTYHCKGSTVLCTLVSTNYAEFRKQAGQSFLSKPAEFR